VTQRATESVESCPRTSGIGILTKAFDGRGFGFIAPDAEGSCEDIFLHISDAAGAKDLAVGTRVRYDVQIDSFNGRPRARSVEAITDIEASQEDSRGTREDQRIEAKWPPSSRGNAYNRDVMLTIFKAMLTQPSSSDNIESLRISTVPLPPCRRSRDQEDPQLDDEHLIARLEERLDKECGADARNMETFGSCSGWSYEEALEANAKLKLSREIEESTVGASSRQSPSPSEDDGSEDGKDRHSYGVEALFAADKWNWELSSLQAKILDDHRQIWEEEKHMTCCDTASVQVFQ
jgi:cold shock CspA family protein